ncbi:hypothetical protein [Candidatus Binatus sp.]
MSLDIAGHQGPLAAKRRSSILNPAGIPIIGWALIGAIASEGGRVRGGG